nr:hypothetical protein CFP56_22872 [Quercus suber]
MFLSAIEIATEPKAIMQQSQDSPVESLAPKSEHGEKKKDILRSHDPRGLKIWYCDIEYNNADMFGDENDSEYDDDNEEFKPDEVDSLYLA